VGDIDEDPILPRFLFTTIVLLPGFGLTGVACRVPW
jgi:hypothetical protein